jgi:hypothetical protein
LRREVDRAWRDDVALELWIDSVSDTVDVRLEGVVDAATGSSLLNVVQGCLSEGKRDFRLDTGGVRIAPSGWAVLHALRQRVNAAGGRLHWDFAIVSS